MVKVQRRKTEGKITSHVVEAGHQEVFDPTNARFILIQQLFPLGLEALQDVLQEEVVKLAAGVRYEHNKEQRYSRWGSKPGSVILGE